MNSIYRKTLKTLKTYPATAFFSLGLIASLAVYEPSIISTISVLFISSALLINLFEERMKNNGPKKSYIKNLPEPAIVASMNEVLKISGIAALRQRQEFESALKKHTKKPAK